MISIMKQNKDHPFITFCFGILLIVLLIQLAGTFKGDRLVFPPVREILSAFLGLLGSGKTYTLILTTLTHLCLVLLLSTVIGICLGLCEGIFPIVRSLLTPLMIFLRSIPMIVLVILIMVIIPYKHVPLLASSLVLIPMISEAVYEGCQRIDPELIDVYRLNSNLSPNILVHVYLPLIAGYTRQAYISAAGMGVKMVVSTEYLVQTRNSLGKAIYTSSYFNQYSEIYAYALIMILLVLLISEIPLWLGQTLQKREETA